MVNSSFAQVVAVCGRLEVAKVVVRTETTALVSLLDRGCHVPTPSHIHPDKHIRIHLLDITDPDGFDAPVADHVDRLLLFFRALSPADRVTVHCEAGLSRSTATALAFLTLGGDPHAAADILYGLRPVASPNPLLTELFDEALNLEGKLIEAGEELRGRCALYRESCSIFP